ncbi:MAG: carboxypeptidase-like regulatory domain-containing protein, partial [Bacteroidota bacterium]
MAFAQRTISGTVRGDDGEPLIGASVLVKGTSTGTITDVDGTYSLQVPAG